jgi:formylmethanofuran dehydrogenase subunit E
MNARSEEYFSLENLPDESVRIHGHLCPDTGNIYAAQAEAYKVMTDSELFTVMDVTVALKPEDMPGRPLRRVRCSRCGEQVQDMREILVDGTVLCRPCGDGGYYSMLHEDRYA